MGQWVSWLRALLVACSTVEVFAFFISCFYDFSYVPMIEIENPFSEWFTKPWVVYETKLLSKKYFALTALRWLDYLAIAFAQPSHSKAADLKILPAIKEPKRTNLLVGAKIVVTFYEHLKIEINLISYWISVVLAVASLGFWKQGS